MMQSAMVSGLYDQLSEEDKGLIVEYLEYLVARSRKRRAENAERAFSQIDGIIGSRTVWDSEEEMIKELAEFRRKRMEL